MPDRFSHPPRHRRVAIATIALGLFALQATHGVAQTPRVVELDQNGQTLVGMQLVRTSTSLLLLATDGQLHHFDQPTTPMNIRESDAPFTPDSAVAMRAKLTREFGRKMEVVATKHFLVVQPRGRGKQWPDMFESLHRQFTQQMRLRGVNVRSGRFPMVAVVLPDRPALQAELDRQRIAGGNIVGVYVTASNRVYTFDGGMNDMTAAVIRHEAAHQSAFNFNVHNRLNETPKWITEGIGMMFEPSAMATAGSSARPSDRMNAEAVSLLKARYADRTRSFAADLARLVAGDEMFGSATEVSDAYALAWVAMYFLAERKPSAFAAMLNHTASRSPFETYPADARLADFQRIVGRSVEQTANDIRSFITF
jgi:hypothetical protein